MYQDMGGSLLLYNPDQPDQRLYIDCVKRERRQLNKWLGLSTPSNNYSIVWKRDILVAGHQGIEAILAVTAEVHEMRRWDDFRLVRFYMEHDGKVCTIESWVDIERSVLEKMISSFKVIGD
jgi:hypothetical protein